MMKRTLATRAASSLASSSRTRVTATAAAATAAAVPRSSQLSPSPTVPPRRTFFDLRKLAQAQTGSAGGSTGRQVERFPAPEGYSWPPPTSAPSSANAYHDHQTLPYTPRQLYNLVADVDSYEEFLPFCTTSRVIGDAPSGSGEATAGTRRVHAELGVGFKGLQEKYTSLVEMKDGQWVRASALPHPLFKHLSTTWTFMPAANAPQHTQIIFELNYAFASPLYATLASGVFEELASKMMAAFEERAKEVYG